MLSRDSFMSILLALCSIACGRHSHQPTTSRLRHLADQDQNYGLTHEVTKEGLRLCVLNAAAPHDPRWSDEGSLPTGPMIHRAIGAWLEPMQALTSQALAAKVKLLTITDGCRLHPTDMTRTGTDNLALADGTLVFDERALASQTYTWPDEHHHPTVLIGHPLAATDIERVLLHEMGHAFGLSDTYDGAGVGPQRGQPWSVMSDSRFDHLQTDDQYGVQFIFCSLYPSLVDKADCRDIPASGARMNAKLLYRIDGLILRDSDDKAAPGVIVESIDWRGPQSRSGLQEGDVIVRFNGQSVARLSDLQAEMLWLYAPSVRVTVRRYNDPGRTVFGEWAATLALSKLDEASPR